MRWMFVLLLIPLASQAAVYKCPGVDGRVTFSDRPCAGAAASPEHKVELRAPAPAQGAPAVDATKQASEWEEAQRFYYVEIPALERKAAELMASPDPQRQQLGRDMAWQAHKGREAFKQLEQAHAARQATDKRYDDARRTILGR